MIYFDNAATTKPSALAIAKANEFNNEKFYNPSALYQQGIDNLNEIKKTKDKFLKFLGLVSGNSNNKFSIVIPSSANTSNNTSKSSLYSNLSIAF